jgi:predicted KAP-like P-loop ATPase
MSEALFKIKPTKEMEANDRAGLISLMTALGQKPLEQIPVFLSGLDDFVVQNVLNKYTKALEPFYKSERIRDWFKDNIRSL